MQSKNKTLFELFIIEMSDRLKDPQFISLDKGYFGLDKHDGIKYPFYLLSEQR